MAFLTSRFLGFSTLEDLEVDLVVIFEDLLV
jgi:hypothetical protein